MDLNEAIHIAEHSWAFQDVTLQKASEVLRSSGARYADLDFKLLKTLQARDDARDTER